MLFCTECGANVPDGVRFCTECGNQVDNGALTQPQTAAPQRPATVGPQPQSQQQSYGASYAAPAVPPALNGSMPPPKNSKYAVMGTGAYFGLMLLFSIPIIGWIACAIMAFTNGNLNRKNFAKAMFIFVIIGIVLSVVLYFVSFWVLEAVQEFYLGQSGVFDLLG